MSKDIRVLLYYKYVPIENAEAYRGASSFL